MPCWAWPSWSAARWPTSPPAGSNSPAAAGRRLDRPGRPHPSPGRHAGRLAPRRLVASGPKVQVDRAALELELGDLALTVIMASGPEPEQLGISRELLQLGQQ